MGEWQPVETAPEGERVLVWQANWPRQNVATRGTTGRGNAHRWFASEGEISPPTHWMALPDPPR